MHIQPSAVGSLFLGALKLLGVIAILLLMSGVQSTSDEINEQEAMLQNWRDVEEYAVFYPSYNGEDGAAIASGDNSQKLAESRDLYPALDDRGALYVDAYNFTPGLPESGYLPEKTMRVNRNYTEKFPIVDADGNTVSIDQDESDWVVLVPEQFRSSELSIRQYFESSRTGENGVEGAIQAQEGILGEPAPEAFNDQGVEIIWTASEQRLFTFDSRVNPDQGNTVSDPIIEVMTSTNSLPVDRINMITGELDSPLKVKTNGDTSAELVRIASLLDSLNLDDNLKTLVTASEARNGEIARLQDSSRRLALIAASSLVLMLVFSVMIVSIAFARNQRRIVVRRAFGWSLIRSCKEAMTAAVVPLLAGLVFGSLFWFAQGAGVVSGGNPGNAAAAEQPALDSTIGFTALVGLIVFIDLAVVYLAAAFTTRRAIASWLKGG